MNSDARKKLSLDVSDFETLRSKNYIYIDKTHMLYNMIDRGRLYFIIRPRRFGKSLMLSTFKAIFNGKKELFEDLWIASSDYAWPVHPVLYFDFSRITFDNYEQFIISLDNLLTQCALAHNIDASVYSSAGDKLQKIIIELSTRGKIVVLVDEYDKILYDKLGDDKLLAKVHQSVAGFFAVLKSLDQHLEFVCVTGVSNFARTSLLSGMNTLVDISLDKPFATLLGFTHQEFDKYFESYIRVWTHDAQCDFNELRSALIDWYDGYRFAADGEPVFNPVSIAYALTKQKIDNYWSVTGVTSYLVSRVIRERTPLPSMQSVRVKAYDLRPFELNTVQTTTLLYQTGYLTISSYDAASDTYTMDYPNLEVKGSFEEDILRNYKERALLEIGDNYTPLVKALKSGDAQEFCEQLKPILAHIPYQIQIHQEAYYHSLLQAIVAMMPGRSFSEVQTDIGRMDMFLEMENYIYVFEFKLKTSPKQGLTQIESRQYNQRFMNAGKQIILIAIAFNPDQKGLAYEYQIKEVVREG